jgi:hypothetical protein
MSEQKNEIDPIDFKSMTEKRDKKKAEQEQMVPISMIAELLKHNQSSAMTPESLRALLEEVGKSNATAMQTAITRQNPNYVSVTPYTKADGSRPQVKREIFFGPQGTGGKGWRLDPESLTPVELELANRFERGRRSARDGQWTGDVVLNGTQEELVIKVPMANSDQRQDLPSFGSILREILDGPKAANPDRLAERVEELERLLAAKQTVAVGA